MEINELDLKKMLLEMMIDIDDFCRLNNIKYYLMYGTLLGAVRHKGFIPWDDDIDVCMPRKDYDYFFKNYKSKNGFFKALNCNNDNNYYLQFGKVIDTRTELKEHISSKYSIGMYIDIFPIDNLSNDDNKNIKLYNKIKFYLFWQNIKLSVLKNKKIYKKIICFCLKFFTIFISYNNLAKKIDRLTRTYESNEKSENCGLMSLLVYNKNHIIPSYYFDNQILLKFEGKFFFGPLNYDEVLKHFYNDYMQLPPIEKRVSHHRFDLKFRK